MYATDDFAQKRVGRVKKGQETQDARFVAINRALTMKRLREPKYKSTEGRRLFRKRDELIEKAWLMFKLREQEGYINNLKRRFEVMESAMSALAKTDKRLHDGALVKDVEEMMFSRRLRPPTQTPPTEGWRMKNE